MIDLCFTNTIANDQNVYLKDKIKRKCEESCQEKQLNVHIRKTTKEVGNKKSFTKTVKPKPKISLTKSAKKRLNKKQRKTKF